MLSRSVFRRRARPADSDGPRQEPEQPEQPPEPPAPAEQHELDDLLDAPATLQDLNPVVRPTTPNDERWTCAICLQWFQDPVRTLCGHTFCRACFAGVSSEPEVPCPLCRAVVRPAADLTPDEEALAEMRSTVLPCPNDGCTERIVPAAWEAHNEQCAYAHVACEFAAHGCGFQGARRGLEPHRRDCAYAPLAGFFQRHQAQLARNAEAQRALTTRVREAMRNAEVRAVHREAEAHAYSTSTPWHLVAAAALLWHPRRWRQATRHNARFNIFWFATVLFLAPPMLLALGMWLGSERLLLRASHEQGWCSALLSGLCFEVANPVVGGALMLVLFGLLVSEGSTPQPRRRWAPALATCVVTWLVLGASHEAQRALFLALLPAIAVNRSAAQPVNRPPIELSCLARSVHWGVVYGVVLQVAGSIESGLGTVVVYHALHAALHAIVALVTPDLPRRLSRRVRLFGILGLHVAGSNMSTPALLATVAVESATIATQVALCGAGLLITAAFMQALVLLLSVSALGAVALKRASVAPPARGAPPRRNESSSRQALVALRVGLVFSLAGWTQLVRDAVLAV